jgi:hypothetical protein
VPGMFAKQTVIRRTRSSRCGLFVPSHESNNNWPAVTRWRAHPARKSGNRFTTASKNGEMGRRVLVIDSVVRTWTLWVQRQRLPRSAETAVIFRTASPPLEELSRISVHD